MYNCEDHIFEIGSEITYRADWGRGTIKTANIVDIDLMINGSKTDTTPIKKMGQNLVDQTMIGLDNGHWCYGHQLI